MLMMLLLAPFVVSGLVWVVASMKVRSINAKELKRNSMLA